MSKHSATHISILDQALELSSQVGLEGLTIGELAKRVGMSKSGLYAHFQSKQSLQCEVLDAAARRFVDVVLAPAFKQARGLPRIHALFDLWLDWEAQELRGGCPFIAAGSEFDDRPGPVRDQLVSHLRDLLGAIRRSAKIGIEERHLSPDLDVAQFAYEFWAILMAYHHFGRLLQGEDARRRARLAFEHLLATATA